MRIIIFLLMMSLVSCNQGHSVEPQTNPVSAIDFTEEYFELMNAHRKSLGLSSLILSPEISKISQIHSDNMAKGSVAFGHSGFSTRCTQVRSLDPQSNLCGEIVAMGQNSPAAVLKSWLNSPGHKAKIEESRYTHTGISFHKNAQGIYYWTQIFLEIN
jgi:uncharacterized protein YkwD